MIQRSMFASAVLLTVSAPTLVGQFQVPLPSHLSDDVVRLSKTESCAKFQGESQVIALKADATQGVVTLGPDDPLRPGECILRRSLIASRLKPSDDKAVSRLFGGNSLAALDQLAGGFAGSQAYVASALVSGNAGDFRFNATYLRSSSRADSGQGDTSSSARLRRASDRMTQLVMNGGEAAARFIMPHLATGGINWQSSWGSYLGVGLLGAVEEHAPLPVAVSFVTEYQSSLAIREASTYKRLGDIYIAIRPAISYVFGKERIVAGQSDQLMPFLQASVGVRTTDKLRYGVLYTLVPGHLNRYVPTFQVVAQTTLSTVPVKK